MNNFGLNFNTVDIIPEEQAALRHVTPHMRFLPVLTSVSFDGESEYLDHLFSLIGAPLLNYVNRIVTSLPVLDISQIPLFIDCAEPFKGLNRADMRFIYDYVDVVLSSRKGPPPVTRWSRIQSPTTPRVGGFGF